MGQDARSTAKKLVQLGLLAYLLAAVLYTTSYLLTAPWSSVLYLSPSIRKPRSSSYAAGAHSVAVPRVDLISQVARAQESLDEDERTAFLTSLLANDDLLFWPNTPSSTQHTSFREETFLAKAFSQSMHPTRIIPFFYKATGPIDEGDVTITTLVTSNRFKVLKKLVEKYQGPISVTIHIPMPPSIFESSSAYSQFLTAVESLEDLYNSSPHFATYVDVHLALSPFSGIGSTRKDPGTTEGGRQFNVWRNVARLFARTEFVMMLDVDFAVCTDWRSTIRTAIIHHSNSDLAMENTLPGPRFPINATMDAEIFSQLRAGAAALVIPAFEYVKQEDGIDQTTFPRDKSVRFA